jgi:hypothetical protein
MTVTSAIKHQFKQLGIAALQVTLTIQVQVTAKRLLALRVLLLVLQEQAIAAVRAEAPQQAQQHRLAQADLVEVVIRVLKTVK